MIMAKDLLLEIGTEEIPARFIPGILAQMESLASTRLAELRLAFEAVEVYATPRRLTLCVKQVAEQQLDQTSENKGPSVKIAFDAEGNPSKAAQGFARGQKVDPKDLVVKDGYVYAIVHEEGQATEALLPSF
jgi:glycyl-tRNA synthetase beta chain